MKKLFFFAAMAVVLLGCKQNEPEQPQPEPQQEAEENYFMNPMAFNGTFIETGNALLYAAEQASLPAPARVAAAETTYPLISWTPQDGTWPIDLNVDYGSQKIVGKDGLEHTGTMLVHATGRFENEGTQLDVQFQNFYVYGAVLHGTQHISNTGKDEKGSPKFEVTVENAYLGASKTWIYNETTTRVLKNGLRDNGTMDPDVTTHSYGITGRMEAQSQVDTIPGYTVAIYDNAPMHIIVGDLYPVSGQLEIHLSQPISYTMEGMTLQMQDLVLEFTGINDDDTYGAQVTAQVSFGMATQEIKLAFSLDKDGIIEESIHPVTE